MMQQRERAVRQLVERVRRIGTDRAVTRDSLDAIKSELIALASRSELFPPHQFANLPGRTGTIYHLAEDPDGSYALYGSAGTPGNAQPPHNHTTWAAIAGVFGQEHNVFYRRADADGTPGEARLEKTGELTVVTGRACAFLPDDFHTIEVTGTGASLHLHLYGRSLENLPERVFFEDTAGGTGRRFMAAPEIFSPRLSAQDARQMIASGSEFAILDVREEGVHSRGHVLLASSCPLSRLEMVVPRRLPRRDAPVLLMDDGDELLAQQAARVLRRYGYRNLAVLAGGLRGWREAGYEVYSGMHVPSKAFGEYVEHRDQTPRISAAELESKLKSGTRMIVVDSRPLDEFCVMNIPGATDCPGAELVYRVPELVSDPETLVVVNCAGRTRSIIGAQSLINAGLPNRVVALKNGTMGWHLAGYELEHGQTRAAPVPGPQALSRARALAATVSRRFGIERIDRTRLDEWRAEDDRSTYVFDVRSPQEYAEGHLPGSISAPGGQLVQATDTFAAVRNARIVLVDDHGVRATMTASWLLQMGWPEVFVLEDVLAVGPLQTGMQIAHPLGFDGIVVKTVTAAALADEIARGGVQVLDFATSLNHRAGRIPGAAFAIRSRLQGVPAKLGTPRLVVCTSPDGELARYAARDLDALMACEVVALEGGTRAWRDAGMTLESGEGNLLEAAEDVYYKPYDGTSQIEAAMRDYLQWEVALNDQIRRDPDIRFRDFAA